MDGRGGGRGRVHDAGIRVWRGRQDGDVRRQATLRGSTDRVAIDRVIVALGLEKDDSAGTSAAISRCGVTAIGMAL